jgi:hypothetical protein
LRWRWWRKLTRGSTFVDIYTRAHTGFAGFFVGGCLALYERSYARATQQD